jgi:capsular polysaccharide biosynthesis protein
MELREYWRIFRRRLWVPIVLVLVTTSTVAVFGFLAKPNYTATATVLAKSSQSQASVGLSFPQVVESNSLALRVVQELHLGMTVDQLSSQIKVTSQPGNLYQVSVTDRDPDKATQLANQVATDATAIYLQVAAGTTNSPIDKDVQDALKGYLARFLAAQRALVQFNQQHPDAAAGRGNNIDLLVQAAQLQLERQVAQNIYTSAEATAGNWLVSDLNTARAFEASVVDPAAARPTTGGRLFQIVYAAALALILGVGLILLLEYLDKSIRDPEAAEELIGAPVVGVIPKASSRTLRAAKGLA